MDNDLIIKTETKFIKKSNIIVRAVTNQSAGIMTQRLNKNCTRTKFKWYKR